MTIYTREDLRSEGMISRGTCVHPDGTDILAIYRDQKGFRHYFKHIGEGFEQVDIGDVSDSAKYDMD